MNISSNYNCYNTKPFFSVYSPKTQNNNTNINNNSHNIEPKASVNYLYTTPIFMSRLNSNAKRRVRDIDERVYQHELTEHAKKFLRKRCENFTKTINVEELAVKTARYLPLMHDEDMKNFVDFCKKFSSLKDKEIICLGRSPKWFLNTSLWMKDGIEGYKFVAFSKFWYTIQDHQLVRDKELQPTEDEKKAYKKYLTKIGADPVSIINKAKETGDKVVIMDYVAFGKGMTSFLDLLSEFAEEDGVLDEFAKSFRIYIIGNRDYMERFYHQDELVSDPHVVLPKRLNNYDQIIKQEFHNMPESIFEQMLNNENTNECRATFYPHEAWTIYDPDKYKTGIIPPNVMQKLKKESPQTGANFTTAMRDYRNLLNFRILDYLAQNDLLKEV